MRECVARRGRLGSGRNGLVDLLNTLVLDEQLVSARFLHLSLIYVLVLVLQVLLVDLHAQELGKVGLVVFLGDTLPHDSVLVVLDARLVQAEHLAVVNAPFLQFVFETDGGEFVAALRVRVNDLLLFERVPGAPGLVILAHVARHGVHEEREALPVLQTAAHQVVLLDRV